MKVRAAVVQGPPAAFDRARPLEKLGALLSQATRQGAELAVFPEAFVSAYPKGLDFGAVVGRRTREGREQFLRYFGSGVEGPRPDVDRTARMARQHRRQLVGGAIQRAPRTPFCTARFFAQR